MFYCVLNCCFICALMSYHFSSPAVYLQRRRSEPPQWDVVSLQRAVSTQATLASWVHRPCWWAKLLMESLNKPTELIFLVLANLSPPWDYYESSLVPHALFYPYVLKSLALSFFLFIWPYCVLIFWSIAALFGFTHFDEESLFRSVGLLGARRDFDNSFWCFLLVAFILF